MAWVDKHAIGNISFLILENTPGLDNPPKDKHTKEVLGPSNLAVICYLFKQRGFVFKCWRLCPRLFGSPQGRPRLWMAVVKISTLSITADEALEMLGDLMDRFVGRFEQNLLSEYLLQDDSDVIARNLGKSAYGCGAGAPKRRRTTLSKWPETSVRQNAVLQNGAFETTQCNAYVSQPCQNAARAKSSQFEHQSSPSISGQSSTTGTVRR